MIKISQCLWKYDHQNIKNKTREAPVCDCWLSSYTNITPFRYFQVIFIGGQKLIKKGQLTHNKVTYGKCSRYKQFIPFWTYKNRMILWWTKQKCIFSCWSCRQQEGFSDAKPLQQQQIKSLIKKDGWRLQYNQTPASRGRENATQSKNSPNVRKVF